MRSRCPQIRHSLTLGSFAQISAATRTAAQIDFGFVRADFGWIIRAPANPPQINFGFVRRFFAALLIPSYRLRLPLQRGWTWPRGFRRPWASDNQFRPEKSGLLLITRRSFRTILASFRKNRIPNRVAVPNRRVFRIRSDGRRLRSSCYPTSVKVAGGFVRADFGCHSHGRTD